MSWKPPAAWPAPAAATPDTHETADTIVDADAPAAACDQVIVEPPRVFISYRRDDTSDFVDVLSDRLRDDLTSQNVYRDVDSNILGEPWAARIETEIDRSDAVMVVVGRRWTGPDDVPVEQSRLWDDDDMVRREVALALRSDNRFSTLPILVDDATLPTPLPDDLEPVRERHNVPAKATEIAEPESAAYQRVLVGVWHAKKETEPNGVIVFGGESAKARAVVAEIVHKLQHQALSDLTEVTRYACNARVLSRRRVRRLGRKYPDVIIVVDDESADSPILAARVDEIRRRKIRNVVVVTIGGTIVFGAGAAVGKGGLSGLSDQLGSALSALEPARVVGSVGKLLAWHATATIATKAVAATIGVGAIGMGAWAVNEVIDDDDLDPLVGDWVVEGFAYESTGPVRSGAFGPLPGGPISFEPFDENCKGDRCDLEATEGPDFLRGAVLNPGEGGSYDVDLPRDEVATIRSITGDGVWCYVDDEPTEETTRHASLGFEVGVDDNSDELRFFVTIDVPQTRLCAPVSLTWSAEAVRVLGD